MAKIRKYPLGFPITAIATGVTLNVTASTQVLFRSRRLIIPSIIASLVLVNDFRIGKDSQFLSSGPVPGRAFVETAVGVDLSLDTAQVSQSLSLNVQNTSLATISFMAAVLGDSSEAD